MTEQRRRIDQVMDDSFTRDLEDVSIEELRQRRVMCDEHVALAVRLSPHAVLTLHVLAHDGQQRTHTVLHLTPAELWGESDGAQAGWALVGWQRGSTVAYIGAHRILWPDPMFQVNNEISIFELFRCNELCLDVTPARFNPSYSLFPENFIFSDKRKRLSFNRKTGIQ